MCELAESPLIKSERAIAMSSKDIVYETIKVKQVLSFRYLDNNIISRKFTKAWELNSSIKLLIKIPNIHTMNPHTT